MRLRLRLLKDSLETSFKLLPSSSNTRRRKSVVWYSRYLSNLIFVVVSMVLVGHEPGLHGKCRLDHLRIVDDTPHEAEFQLLPFCRSSLPVA
jgi:hypothetical protein